MQQHNGRPPVWSYPGKLYAAQDEMRRPDGAARMEQRSDLLAAWVDATEIRPFVSVAAVTGPGEIAELGLSTMLTGDDVFEMKGLERREPVREVAVFAALAGAFANLLAPGFVHLTRALPASDARPSAVVWQ